MNFRIWTIILKFRDIKWTGQHTVPTANTNRSVVFNRAGGCFFESFDKTHRRAGRLQTMITLNLSIFGLCRVIGVLVTIDHREAFRAGSSLPIEHGQIIKWLFGRGKLVYLVAGLFTFAAADTQRAVK